MTDGWHPTVTADLQRLQAALHDIVDIPNPDDGDPQLVKVKRGHPAERAARRGNDTDTDYHTIPDPDIRPPHTISDPTYRATTAWAGRIENACTELNALTDIWHTAVATSLHPFGRDVHTPTGDPWPPPTPDTYTTATGRTVVTVAPSRAGLLIRRHIGWMHAAADALEDWRTHPSCFDEQLHARLSHVQRRTRGLVDRHRRRQTHVKGPTRCLNPHGLHNHPAGPKPVSGVCRRCQDGSWWCADPLDRGCTRQTDDGRTDCPACRKQKQRANA